VVRSVRRVTPVSPGACAVNRLITDECSSTSGPGSSPALIVQSASLPAALSGIRENLLRQLEDWLPETRLHWGEEIHLLPHSGTSKS